MIPISRKRSVTDMSWALTMPTVQTSSAKAALNALLNRPSRSSLPSPKRSSIPSPGSLNRLIARAESSHPNDKAAAISGAS